MRIDKYIWTVRLFKTRSLANKACSSDKVKLNGDFVKTSKSVAINDEIAIKTIPIWRTFKVLDFPKSRVGAKLVSSYLVETTSKDDLLQLEHIQNLNRKNKVLGIKGRPTKKDRRNLDQLNR
ncbi:MAG: S4 domain-containing protein [Vicingaceae bacterium]|nr:S4 domain-containing protein [Vicingaceae bacterium]